MLMRMWRKSPLLRHENHPPEIIAVILVAVMMTMRMKCVTEEEKRKREDVDKGEGVHSTGGSDGRRPILHLRMSPGKEKEAAVHVAIKKKVIAEKMMVMLHDALNAATNPIRAVALAEENHDYYYFDCIDEKESIFFRHPPPPPPIAFAVMASDIMVLVMIAIVVEGVAMIVVVVVGIGKEDGLHRRD